MPPANFTSRRNPEPNAIARVEVLVKPGSKQPGIAIDGSEVVLRVREHATGGAANAACIDALAVYLRVAPSSVTLLRGARGRRKLFEIAGITTAQAIERLPAR
jgi:uncharacterized protein YggU (UPF0235/DUF167 family)